MDNYLIKLDNGEMVTITASVSYDIKPTVLVHKIVKSTGEEILFASLLCGARNRLIKKLISADNFHRDKGTGSTICKHGQYLLEQFCIKCLAEAKPTP